MSLRSLLVLISAVSLSAAYPDGAPDAACGTLTPNHGAAAQNSASPYVIVTRKLGLNQFEVTLTSPQRVPFRGFILTSKHKAGKFELADSSNLAKLVQCSAPADTATHTNNNDKNQVKLMWTATNANDDLDNVRFDATVVKTKTEFWTGVTNGAGVTGASALTAVVLALVASVYSRL